MANQFTDPIRYFKANDPYYYEIDNIPLQQLQENCLWLKDQIGGSLTGAGTSRDGFSELKPFALGGTNVVRVNPGRYTARVNDAYQKGNLINLILTKKPGEKEAGKSTSFPKYTSEQIDSVDLNNIYSNAIGGYSGLNGLLEHIQHFFSTVVWLKDAWESWPLSTQGFTSYNQTAQNGPTILSTDALWASAGEDRFGTTDGDAVDKFDSINFKEYFPGSDFIIPGQPMQPIKYDLGNHISHYQTLATLFTQKWAGVFRTAVVDVPLELQINLPDWEANDFGTGNDPGWRIDLVFIYTHPVDSVETTIRRGNSLDIITNPILGVVKGAAAILDENDTTADIIDSEGNRGIIGSKGDTLNNTGFDGEGEFGTRGSFPAPDDLMNLAPLIAQDVEDTNLCLLGQSILPVAYVVVRVPGDPDQSQAVSVSQSDIIDIRPFFRTAELAYNERAGIAAANPPLSIANPAIGKTELWNATDSIVATPLNEFVTPDNDLDLGSNKIINVGEPSDDPDAATKKYVDDADTDLQSDIDGIIGTPLNQWGAMFDSNADFDLLNESSMNTKVTSLANPESPFDAANKNYVDGVVNSLQNPMIEVTYSNVLSPYRKWIPQYAPGTTHYGVGYGNNLVNEANATNHLVPQAIKARNFHINYFDTDETDVAKMIECNAPNNYLTFLGENKCAIWKITLDARVSNYNQDDNSDYLVFGFGVPYTDGGLLLRRLHFCPHLISINRKSGDTGATPAPVTLTTYVQFGGTAFNSISIQDTIGHANNNIDFGLFMSSTYFELLRLDYCYLTMERIGYTTEPETSIEVQTS